VHYLDFDPREVEKKLKALIESRIHIKEDFADEETKEVAGEAKDVKEAKKK